MRLEGQRLSAGQQNMRFLQEVYHQSVPEHLEPSKHLLELKGWRQMHHI